MTKHIPTGGTPATRRLSAPPGRKTHTNPTRYEVADIRSVVAAVYKSERITQAGGWHIEVSHTRSTANPVTVKVVRKKVAHACDYGGNPSAICAEGIHEDSDSDDARVYSVWKTGKVLMHRYHHTIRVGLPRRTGELPAEEVGALAMLLAKEIGLHPVTVWWQLDARWSADHTIRVKSDKPKPTTAERVQAREDNARKMLSRAEADADRALARCERWRGKVKYYEAKERRRSSDEPKQ
jgi:hypothetical protein